jgi:septum site-determining protein MinC
MAAAPDFSQAGELKIGQVGIANLRVRVLDTARLAAEMAERVRGAPKLFDRAAVILDFGGLAACPTATQVNALVAALRQVGVLPVAIAYGTSEIDAVSREAGLPLLAKFRASYERGEPAPAPVEVPAAAPAPAAPVAAKPAPNEPGLMHAQPVRSGQQLYAQGRDLTVCATVGAGAEVIADGSIHIYGALRGRALAGAGGFEGARIFCREFQAELVAIAGTYKVLEDIPPSLRGKSVQVRLEYGQLLIEELA